MTLRASITADIKQAQVYFKEIGDMGIRRAAARALNDAFVTVRAEGARMIKAEHPALKIGDIKSQMIVTKAHPNAGGLSASVETTGKPLSLKLFNVKQLKSGRVTAKMGKTQRPVQHRGQGAFIVDKFGGEVFVRRHIKGRQIRRFRGPSLPGVFRAQAERFLKLAVQRFQVTFKSRLTFEIEKARRKAVSR